MITFFPLSSSSAGARRVGKEWETLAPTSAINHPLFSPPLPPPHALLRRSFVPLLLRSQGTEFNVLKNRVKIRSQSTQCFTLSDLKIAIPKP